MRPSIPEQIVIRKSVKNRSANSAAVARACVREREGFWRWDVNKNVWQGRRRSARRTDGWQQERGEGRERGKPASLDHFEPDFRHAGSSLCRSLQLLPQRSAQSRARIDRLLFSAPRTAPQTVSIHLLFLHAFFRPPLWVRRGTAML